MPPPWRRVEREGCLLTNQKKVQQHTFSLAVSRSPFFRATTTTSIIMHDDRWRVSTAARRGWAAAGVGALRAAGQRGDAAHAHACPSAARARRASFKQLAGRESKPKSMRASRTAREGAGSEPVEISTSAGTPRTPTPFPVQRVHGERVTSSASPAAQQQMWPALITKKGEFVSWFMDYAVSGERYGVGPRAEFRA